MKKEDLFKDLHINCHCLIRNMSNCLSYWVVLTRVTFCSFVSRLTCTRVHVQTICTGSPILTRSAGTVINFCKVMLDFEEKNQIEDTKICINLN